SWPSGIVVPVYTLPDSLWKDDHTYVDKYYLEIGWGDADYFPHHGLNFWYALKAVFWPTRSVLHIRPIGRKREQYYWYTDVVRIEVNNEPHQPRSLYLEGELALDKNGKIIPAAVGLFPDSHFYEGSSSYYFPNNSNVWAARAVKRAGFPIHPIWHQTTGCVLNKVEDFGELVVEDD